MQQLESLEPFTDPESLLNQFYLVRELAKDFVPYRIRFGEFYDPLDNKPIPQNIHKDAYLAWQEYSKAERSATGETRKNAQNKLDALRTWVQSDEAEGQPGVDTLRSYLGN
jgi:hypothetical protein